MRESVRLNTERNRVELAHFTVEEFLSSIDPDGQKAFIHYNIGNRTFWNYLTLASLTYICYEDFEPILPSHDEHLQLQERFPFLIMAIRHWILFLSQCVIQDEQINLILMKFFNPQRPHSLRFWLCQVADGFDYDVLITMPVAPITYAAMLRLPEICKRLVDDGQSCNALSPFGSPMHLALMGDAALSTPYMEEDELSDFNTVEESEDVRLCETVRILLDGGADIHTSWKHPVEQKKRSILGLAAHHIPITDRPFQELLAMKAPSELDSISVLWKFYETREIDMAQLTHLSPWYPGTSS